MALIATSRISCVAESLVSSYMRAKKSRQSDSRQSKQESSLQHAGFNSVGMSFVDDNASPQLMQCSGPAWGMVCSIECCASTSPMVLKQASLYGHGVQLDNPLQFEILPSAPGCCLNHAWHSQQFTSVLPLMPSIQWLVQRLLSSQTI